MALFTHEDDEGDEIEVMEALNDHRGQLVFNIASSLGNSGVFVTHDRVAALHAVLGEWLGSTTTPVAPNSLIDQLIVKRVAEEMARVLPLHLSPLARCTHGGFCKDANGVQSIPCPEPEPQHAKYEDAHSPLCGQCRQLWTDTHGQPGYPCVRKGDKVWGIDGVPPTEPYCTECMHSWSRHVGTGGCGASMFGTTRLVCGCKRVQS